MMVWWRRLMMRPWVAFGVIVFGADTLAAETLSRLQIGGGFRIAIEAALVALASAPPIAWRARMLLGRAVTAESTKFRSLVDAAPEGIIGLGEDGCIQFANAESQRLFQYAEGELVGRPIEILLPERFRHTHVNKRDDFLSRPKRRSMGSGLEVTARRKDGSEFPVDVSLSHIRLVRGTLVISIIRDVTSQRKARDELLEVNQKLQLGLAQNMRRAEELRQLRQMAEDLQGCGSEKDAHQVVARCMALLFPRYSGALYMRKPSGAAIETAITWGPEADQLTAPDNCFGTTRRGSLDDCYETGGRIYAHQDQNHSSFCVPLLARAENFGVLHLSDCSPSDLRDGIAEPPPDILQAIAAQVSLSIASLRLRETLRLQSIRDPLTDLYNRRFMDEWLRRELPRSSRTHRPISLLMLDLDHFKRFNDTYGHECGDRILREVGSLLQRSVRGGDIACRIGGEELVLLLPDTGFRDAVASAEKLRGHIEALTLFHQEKPVGTITVSIGGAEYPRHGNTPALLLRAADSALYAAKTAGRNRVVGAVDRDCITRGVPGVAATESHVKA